MKKSVIQYRDKDDFKYGSLKISHEGRNEIVISGREKTSNSLCRFLKIVITNEKTKTDWEHD